MTPLRRRVVSGSAVPSKTGFSITQINRQIPPHAHTPMYVWHKYWSRKTWNAVQEYVKAYCPPGGIVFDPFSGSGVTALEALKAGRKAIASDLMPVATEILRLTVKPVNLAKLQERGRVSFTDMWEAISLEFPNSLTSDSTSIKEALVSYARPVAGGEWMLKPQYGKGQIRRAHTRMIALLAEIGKKNGHKIWVGRREQSDAVSEAFPSRSGTLRDYVTVKNIASLEKIHRVEDVEFMDLLWVKDGAVAAAFEVESTTQMTEALKRGSSLDPSVPKFLLLPQDRQDQLRRKLESPLFQNAFANEGWRPVFFEALEEAFSDKKWHGDISTLVDQKVKKAVDRGSGDQGELFAREEMAEFAP